MKSILIGRKDEIKPFKDLLYSKMPASVILNYFGTAGIGKTALLSEFSELSQMENVIPLKINLALSGSSYEVLQSIRWEFKETKFKNYDTAINKLNSIWVKILRENPDMTSKVLSIIKKYGAIGIGGAVGGAILTTIAGPAATVIGTALGAGVGSIGQLFTQDTLQKSVEQFKSVGFSSEEAEFAMNPDKHLLHLFFKDIDKLIKKKKIIFLFDEFERAKNLDGWFRLQFFSSHIDITNQIPTVISSRDKLNYEWQKLERKILPIPVNNLSDADSRIVVSGLGIKNEKVVDEIAKASRGIPGLIESYTESHLLNPSDDSKIRPVQSTLNYLLRTLDHLDSNQRELVEAASILRDFNQETLKYVLAKDVDSTNYSSICSLSFVDQNEKGRWFIKDLIKPLLEEKVRASEPSQVIEINKRAAEYFLLQFSNRDQASLPEDICRAIFYTFRYNRERGLELFVDTFNAYSSPLNSNIIESIITELFNITDIGLCKKEWLYYFQGRLEYIRNNWSDAMAKFEEAKKLLNKDSYLFALCNLQLGRIHFHQGHLNIAFTLFSDAHIVLETGNDKVNKLVSLNHIGRISRRMGLMENSFIYHQKVLNETNVSEEDNQQIIEAHRCLSRLYRDMGLFSKAMLHCLESKKLSKNKGRQYDFALISLREAELWIYLGDSKKAIETVNSVRPILTEFSNDLSLSFSHQILGRAHSNLNQRDEAISNFITALWFARKKIGAQIAEAAVFLDLAIYYCTYDSLERSRGYLMDAILVTEKIDDPFFKAQLSLVEADQLKYARQFNQALEKFELILNYFFEKQHFYYYCITLISMLEIKYCISKAVDLNLVRKLETQLRRESYRDIVLRKKLVLSFDKNSKSREKVIKEILRELAAYSIPFLQSLNKLYSIHQQMDQSISKIEIKPNNPLNLHLETHALPVKELPELQLATKQSIILVHHGLTNQRINEIIQGRDDVELTEEVKNHLPLFAKELFQKILTENINLDNVIFYSSPAKRCYQTLFALVDEYYNNFKTNPTILSSIYLENIGLGNWERKLKMEMLSDNDWLAMNTGRDVIVKASGLSKDNSPSENVLQVLERSYLFYKTAIQNSPTLIVVGHKISTVVSAFTFFHNHLVTDKDGLFNWKIAPFPNHGSAIFIGKTKIIN